MSKQAPISIVHRLNLGFRRRLPQILQSEASECGLACLAMIAGYYRFNVDMVSLRHQYRLSSQGSNLKQLMDVASSLNFKSRGVRLELNELGKLKTPCMLHWDLCHFVVLVSVGRKGIVIQDPALGRRKLSFNSASGHFTGVAMEMWPAANFEPKEARQRLKLSSLLGNMAGFKPFLVKIFSLSLVIEAINLLLPVGTQLVMDHVIIAKDYDLLALISLGLLFFILFRTLVGMFRAWITLAINSMINIQWCNQLFEHLIRLPLDYFEKRKQGDIQSRFFSLDMLRNVFTTSIVNTVIDGIMTVGLLIMMWLYGGWLVWVVVGFMAVYVLMRLATYRLYRQISEEQIVNDARVTSHFMETLYGMGTIKALNLTRIRSAHWINLKVDAINSGIRITKFDMLFGGASSLISTVDQVLILWLGAGLVIEGSLSLGMFVAFNAYRGEFSARTVNLVNTLLQLRMLTLHGERVADIALTKAEPESPLINLFDQHQSVSLSAKDIVFQYDAFSRPIFSGLDVNIAAGESVALVGYSGVGKTTLMKILSGLTKPDSGSVFVNHLDIHKVGIDNYRRHIACVLQDDKLFAGTIEENIAGFDGEMDHEYVVYCAQLSHIHHEIMAMPMGYQTLLGELGGSVSGGQRQRLLIARALYRRPKILFLDEATSHLDIDNEAKINQAISELNITRVIIAHRPSTIASADRVIQIGDDAMGGE
ncbi:peptidase domain-containing ABC transporter [Budvicia diplopodorum]|uniref:peptidase domain-containing ABC transporter n=1 Tax=Budvicia diplopodorum TaxID=1119056 RepID=UPI00135B6A4C|nr:peptidase domain-containing ABC transporter [Budvicia diplopodorum]